MRRLGLYVFIVMGSISSYAQSGVIDNHIYEGNENWKASQFQSAESEYRKAIALDGKNTKAYYNLGNTHYRDSAYDEATQRYIQTQKLAGNRNERHAAFHNLGNVMMQKKAYEKAVEAYKNALRNNPADEQTRYNYALAKKMLEQEQQQQQQNQDQQDQDKQQNQDNKDQQDQQKDSEGEGDDKKEESDQDSDEGKDGKDQEDSKSNEDEKGKPKDQESDDKQQDKDPKKQPQRPKGQMSPEQIKQLLEAMNNQEKQVQDKVNAKKVKGVPVQGKKDW